ncbi:nuclease-related domain-containing protein [Lysinibacillus louembei]|uniref:Nuclease-related domain-containing protein n=1 Tax=Lysinibacillus louembei TaxID=1470088 RepID=A0ABZ0RYE1_9BACI|nr:nuclease-related domain-containing protein [Lysinibacillus louembei]WPK11838.1 nuclease-related domain-containing protein [Lysinibacillus louembei]
MIVLPRQKSMKAAILEAAVRRGFIEFKEELNRVRYGIAGEHYVDRSWHDMQLNEPHFLLHDFQTTFHQIDTIFLCDKFLLVIEIKNIAGRIDFDETSHQFTRTLEDGSIQGFRNPLDQVRRHQRMLQQQFPTFPIIYAVVLAHPKTIIGRMPPHEPVLHSSGLEFHVRKLLSSYTPQVTSKELHAMFHQLRQMQAIVKPQVNIDKFKIRTGVLCEQCDAQMQFERGYFICLSCAIKDDGTLLQQALHDYCLLVNEWITNEEFRRFVHIDSLYAARRLLKKFDFSFEGENRGRKYLISFKE